jgi:hypothetical protein
MSIVMAIDECPRRSCTTLGWMFDASMWVAWECRSPCSVTRHSFKEAAHDVGEAARLQRLAVRLGDDVQAIVGPDAQPEKFLGLRQPPAAQLFDGHGGEGDGSRPAALGLFLPDVPCISLLGARHHG